MLLMKPHDSEQAIGGVPETCRALVIGAGSAGMRHKSVLHNIGCETEIFSRRDASRLRTIDSLHSTISDFRPEYVVIATETSAHKTAVQSLVDCSYGGKLLVEKPLAVDAEVLCRLACRRVGVGFNLRFHPVLVHLRDVLQTRVVYSVAIYCGQHLTTWRPGRTVESQYSAQSRLGGGVLRDLSHELDYATWLFGDVNRLVALGGHITEITTDADDAWGILMDCSKAPIITMQLNYFDTKKQRQIIVNTSDGTFIADLVGNTLTTSEGTRTFNDAMSLSYEAMHRSMLYDSNSSICSVADAQKVDRLIEAISMSSRDRCWVEAP